MYQQGMQHYIYSGTSGSSVGMRWRGGGKVRETRRECCLVAASTLLDRPGYILLQIARTYLSMREYMDSPRCVPTHCARLFSHGPRCATFSPPSQTCRKMGSPNMYRFGRDLQLPNIQVVETGCLGQCGNGPNMLIVPRDGSTPIPVMHIKTPSDYAECISSVCNTAISETVSIMHYSDTGGGG